eukprot:jgi/Tetstr1/454076/TSEL_040995.t1
MSLTDYTTLHPTGDIVRYNAEVVDYPAANVVDTFGTIWISKVHGHELSALEIASAGKVAFTPGDEHSLDMVLDKVEAQVKLQARNQNALVLQNEGATAFLELSDSGAAAVAAMGGDSEIRLDASGNTFSAPSGARQCMEVGGVQSLCVEEGGVSASNLTVNGTDFRVPVGASGARPSGTEGQIFYNSTAERFEGFASGAWSGLGGTVDVDQDTFVAAEAAAGADDDQLRFVTAGEERMRITDTGLVGYGTSNPEYTLDIVGDVRISGNLIAATTAFGGDGRTMQLGLTRSGTDAVVDGLDTNDGSGMTVAGVPEVPILASTHIGRFEKSLRWNYSQAGMKSLGQKDAWESESFWKMRGGAFHLSHTNADTGAETEFIMRCNEQDEFQIVRHLVPTDGTPETYDVIAKFGNKTSSASRRFASQRGHVVVDPDRTSMDTAAATVDAYIESFSSYSDYKVHGALFPVSATPTSAEVLAAAATNGYVSGTLQAGTDNMTQFTFAAMFDGSAVPDALLKFAAVTEQADDGSVSHTPVISFVLNEDAIFDDLVLEVNADTQSAITSTLNFGSITWDDLSAGDKAVFEAWLEDQIIQTARAQGISVQSVELSFQSGSVIASVSTTFATKDTAKVLTSALSSDPLATIATAAATPVPFRDRAPATVTAASVSSQVVGVVRIQTAPTILSVAETSSTSTGITVSYEVSEANPSFAVTSMHALVLAEPLPTPVLPATVKNHPSKQTFAVSAVSGTATVALATGSRAYVYFTAENNGSPAVMSPVHRIVSEPFSVIMPSSVSMEGSSGLYRFSSQDGANHAVTTARGISAFSSAATATAHLIIYPDDDPDIPTTADEVRDAIDGGAVAVTASLP